MNAVTYIKNVGKSFGYAGIDVIKSYNPSTIALANSAKDLGTELYQSVNEFKSNISDIRSEKALGGQIKGIADDMMNNLLSDIKTGNWYNKQRINNAEDELITDLFGDFSFDDFDFEFDDSSDDVKATAASEEQSAKVISKNINSASERNAAAISMATAKSADYIVKTNKENTKAIHSLATRGFNQLTTGLAAINSNISNLVQLGQPLTTHMQNAAVFYTKSTEYQNKSLALLQQIADNTTTKPNTKNGRRGPKYTIDSLMSDGAIDFMAYAEMIKENSKALTDMVKGTLEMFGGVSGVGKMATGSPMKFIPTAIMKSMVPKIMKESMEMFNETLGGFFSTLLGKTRDKQFNGMGGTIFSFLKNYILPESGYKSKLDVSGYEKGKVDWDGMSRKSLIEVIPTQLSQILSALTGNPEKRFDFQSGKWKTLAAVKTEFEKDRIRAASSAGDEYLEYLKKTADALVNQQQISKDQAANLKKQVEQFNYQAFHSDNSEFLDIMKDNFNYQKYGLTKAGWEFIRNANREADRQKKYSIRTNYSSNIYTGRDSFGDQLRRREVDGSDLALQLFSNDTSDNAKARTLLGVDEYNNDIFFYLQGIYQHTMHVSDNLDIFAPNGRRIKGSSIQSKGKIKPIAPLVARVQDTRAIDNKYSSSTGVLTTDSFDQILSQSAMSEAALSAMSGDDFTGVKLPKDLQEYLEEKNAAQLAGTEFKIDKLKESKINAFKDVNANIKAKRLNLKDKISNNKLFGGLSTSIANIFKMPAETVSNFLNAAMVSMRNVLYGEKSTGDEVGIFKFFANGMTKIFNTIDDKIENLFGKRPFEMMKAGLGRLFGTKGADGKRSNGLLSNFYNESKDELKNAGNWAKSAFTGSFNGTAAYGKKVTKTGIVAVSEGELIIPAELNPYYRKRIDKNKQIRSELNAVNRFYGTYADGGTVGSDSVLGATKEFGLAGVKRLGDAAKAITDSLKGKNKKDKVELNINDDGVTITEEVDVKKDRYVISDLLKAAKIDIGGAKGAMGAGALIGAGTSIITGAFVGPILGAGIGAATGLVLRSKRVQEVLFGKDDEKGLLPENVSNFMKNNLPKTAKGALVGGTAGLFMGSPVLGAILGGATGFISSSEQAKRYLFGTMGADGKRLDDGVFKTKTQQMFKKAMPNLSAGAIAGLMVGPFGSPVMNLIAGSAVGMAVNSHKFRDWLFSEETNGSGKAKGLIPMIRERLFDPITKIFDNMSQSVTHTVRNTLHNMAKGARKLLLNAFKGNGILGRAGKAIGRGALGLGGGMIKGPIALLGGLLEGAASYSERNSLRKGYSIRNKKLGRNMSAQERLDLRGQYDDKLTAHSVLFDSMDTTNNKARQLDQLIAAAGGDPSQLTKLTDIADALIDPTKVYDKNIISARHSAKNLLFKNGSNKEVSKIYNLVKSNNFDKAIQLLNNSNIEDKNKIMEYISTMKKNYEDRRGRKDLTKSAKRELIDKSGLGKFFRDSGINIDELNDSDLLNFKDLIKDEQKVAALKSPQEKANEAVQSIPNKIDTIIALLSKDADKLREVDPKLANRLNYKSLGIDNKEINKATESNEPKEGDSSIKFDPVTGQSMKYIYSAKIKDWIPDTSDSSTADGLEDKKTIVKGLGAIPDVANNTKSMKGLFASLKNKLFGGKDEETKKEGFFSKLFDFFKGDDNKGFSLGGIIKKAGLAILGGFAIKNLFKEGGLFDKVGKTLGYSSDADSGKGTYTSESGDTFIDKGGKLINVETGEEYDSDVDGKVQSNGNSSEAYTTASVSDKVKGNLLRAAVTGRRSFAGLIVRKTIPGGKFLSNQLSKQSTKLANKIAKPAVKKIADKIAKTTLSENIVSGLMKFKSFLLKVPLLKNVIKRMDLDGMIKAIGDKAEKGLKKLGANALKNAGKTFLVAVNAVMFIIDFTNGYQDANATFKISGEPSVPQKIISGLIRSVKNLIPFIGTLIPDDLLVDIFCNFVAPALGIDVSEIMKQRDEAEAELTAYNEMNGTDLSWEEYNKQVLNNYTWSEKIGNAFKNIGSNYKAMQYNNKASKSASSGGNSGLSAGASGIFVSQRNNRYSNEPLGMSTVGQMGCGPASAVMALSQAGRSYGLDKAIGIASRYQTPGGTNIGYFGDVFNRNGLSANYYNGVNDAGGMINDIRSGKPVVLMGQDSTNTSKDRSPFGPNNHYVVAKGMDAQGNIIVNDPELRSPNKKYSPSILRNVKAAVGAGFSSLVSGSSLNLTKKASSSSKGIRVDDITKNVWSFFRGLGYSEAATAGILGNLQQESNVNPTAIQNNGKGPAAGICQWENYKTKAGRWKAMSDYAKSRGKDWTDLTSQLEFMHKELMSKEMNYFFKRNANMTAQQFMSLSDVRQATLAFEKAFERAGTPMMENRYKYAEQYYTLFTGKTYQYTGGSLGLPLSYNNSHSTARSTIPQGTGGAKQLGLLGGLLSAFSKIGDLFNGNQASAETVDSTGTTSTPTTSTVNANDAFVANSSVGTWDYGTDKLFQKYGPVDYMLDKQGRIKYSMKDRNPDEGSADCSSMVQWAFRKATGIDIGSYTGAQYVNPNLADVYYKNGSIIGSLPNKLEKNDILFFRRERDDNVKHPDRVGHVGVFLGGDRYLHHPSGKGPKLDVLDPAKNQLIKVSRLKSLDQISKEVASGSGSGLINRGLLVPQGNTRYSRYSGGASISTPQTVNVVKPSVVANASGISKDVAAMISAMITLIQQLVSNTTSINDIFLLLQSIATSKGNKEAISAISDNIKSRGDTSDIEKSLSSLKFTMDQILSS